MMQIKFNLSNFARVGHGLAACQQHTPSSLAAVIGLSNNDVSSLCSLRCVRHFVNSLRALRWLETPLSTVPDEVFGRVSGDFAGDGS